jgi:SAM-dependent methyltransferase
MRLKPHSREWYDRLAQMQEGYYYPWQSMLPPFNGEDVYLEMVQRHLGSDKDVLDVGCGHGEVALDIAPHCRSVLAYDRVASYIELARAAAQDRGVENVSFVWADSSPKVHGRARIPAEADAFDLIISRRGPTHWLADARRVARPGALILQLNPERTPTPAWNEELPEPLRMEEPPEWTIADTIRHRLQEAGLELHSCWSFDVPELFSEPEQLYARLSWGFAPEEVPSWAEAEATIRRIFERYGTEQGVVLRFRRFLWQAVVGKSP